MKITPCIGKVMQVEPALLSNSFLDFANLQHHPKIRWCAAENEADDCVIALCISCCRC